MRLALAGAIGFLVGQALLRAAFAQPGWPVLLSRWVGLLFAALWLAHLLRFAGDAVAQLVYIKTLRRLPVTGAMKVRRFFRGLGEGAGWSLPRRGGLNLLGLLEGVPDCSCYFGDECWFFPLFRYCDYSQKCTFIRKGTGDCPTSDRHPTGSCDGICVMGRPPNLSTSDLVALTQAVFTLFANAARAPKNTGVPFKAEIDAIFAPVHRDCRAEAYGWVFSALDVVLGWDMVRGRLEEKGASVRYTDFFLAHVADPEGTPALLEASRDALIAAMESGDEKRLVPPMEGFWARFPHYHPAHSGRCYPHGHGRHATALECHLAEFSVLVRSAITPV